MGSEMCIRDSYTALSSRMTDEEYCNLMLTLIHQTISMLDKMIDKVKADFLRNGGIKEQMYQARIKSRDTDKKDKNK